MRTVNWFTPAGQDGFPLISLGGGQVHAGQAGSVPVATFQLPPDDGLPTATPSPPHSDDSPEPRVTAAVHAVGNDPHGVDSVASRFARLLSLGGVEGDAHGRAHQPTGGVVHRSGRDDPRSEATESEVGLPSRSVIMVCVVCGAPLRPTSQSAMGPPTDSNNRDWMNPSFVVGSSKFIKWQKKDWDPEQRTATNDDQLLDIVPATRIDLDKSGKFIESGINVIGSSQKRRRTIDPRVTPMRIPIHADCLTVVQEFCKYQQKFTPDFRSAADGSPSAVVHYYEIWCQRAIATYPYGPFKIPIKEPHGYLNVPKVADLEEWSSLVNEFPNRMTKYNTSPLAVKTLTRDILRLLRLVPKGSVPADPVVARVVSNMATVLPGSVVAKCLLALEPFVNPPLQCTRVLPPNWWRNMLFFGRFIPWLFDLDLDELVNTQAQIAMDANVGGEYTEEDGDLTQYLDWEHLVRRLAQDSVLEDSGILGRLSTADRAALCNRRRIINLLGLARLGHMNWSVPDLYSDIDSDSDIDTDSDTDSDH